MADDGDDPVTLDEVRRTFFRDPPLGQQGYRREDVGDFVVTVEERLLGRNTLSADEVREVRFRRPKIFRRGYHPEDVDEFLDRVAATLEG